MAIAKAARKKQIDAEITSSLFGEITKFELFLTQNWKMLVTVALLIVVGIGVWAGVQSYRKSAALKAANALSSADTVAALYAALKTYPSEPASRFARLRLAKLLMAEKKFKEADAEFAALAAQPDLPAEFAARVKIDQGYLLENAGMKKEAAQQLANAATSAASAAVRAEAFFGAGRLQAQLGNADQAKALLTQAVALKPQLSPVETKWAVLAEFLLRNVEANVKL